jgi:hypothetical protein
MEMKTEPTNGSFRPSKSITVQEKQAIENEKTNPVLI